MWSDLMKRRVCLFLILTVIFSSIAAGCGEQADTDVDVTVCFVNADRNAIVETTVSHTSDDSQEEYVAALLGYMNDDSLMPEDSQKLMDESMILGTEIKEHIIYFDMDDSFNDISASDKLLIRAGLTKMFLQVKGIKSVGLLVEGEPAKDSYGNPIGPTTSTTFIENPSKLINEYINTSMTLYFADNSGQKLVPESRRVYHSSNAPLEEVVVSEILKGPYESGRSAVMPSDIIVLSVTIQDDICYINFDESIANAVSADVDPYVQIYSLVNSIDAVCKVSRVSFSVNGSSDYTYADEISFDTIFEPRKDLISQTDGD